MFSSFFQDTNLNQGLLKNKMKKFIGRLGESFPEWAMNGLCSGYVFMLLRAELSGKSPKFFSRLSTLGNANEDEIVQMTQLIKNFNSKQKKLINEHFSELKTEIKSFEEELKLIQKNIIEIENEEKATGKTFSDSLLKLRESKNLLSQKIAEKRQIYFDNIEKQVKQSFAEEERELLEQGLEIYYFIHSLLAAFKPGQYLDLHNDKGGVVQQADFIETLALLTSDDLTPKNIDEKKPATERFPIRHAFSFQFGYTEQELTNVLSKTIFENDLVRLNSTNHAMYLKKQGNKFIFYDPNSETGAIEFTSVDELAKKIINCFYEGKEKRTYNLVGIEIFAKNSEAPPSRPKIKELVQDLFQNRNQNKTNNSVNTLGDKNYTTLHMAAKSGNIELIEELVSVWGADPRLNNEEGHNPISLAANRGHEKAVELMTNAVIAKQGEIAMQQIGCIKINDTKETETLSHENKASAPTESKEKQSPLLFAAKKGHLNIIKFLMAKNADVNLENKTGMSPITIAIENGQVNALKVLLASNKGLLDQQNIDTKTPLYFAVAKHQTDCIKILAEHNADLDKAVYKNGSAVLFAANEGFESVIETLADLKADINKTDPNLLSPLHLAAQKGHADVVKMLIERKANLDQTNKSGFTPFLLAACHGHAECVKQLAATKSIDLYREDGKNMTALLFASQKGDAQVVDELIKIRIDINKPNKKGITPVCMAAKHNKVEVFRKLVESKANVNHETPFDASPISLAIEQSNSDLVEILAENKADFNKQLKNGMTPVQFAMTKIQSNIVAILARQNASFDFVAKHPDVAVKFLFTIKSPDYITQNSFLQNKLQVYSKELTNAVIDYIKKLPEKADQLNAIAELKNKQNALGALLQTPSDLTNIISHFEESDKTVLNDTSTKSLR